jgi:hypothetical protein
MQFYGGNVVNIVSVALTFGDFGDISADGSAEGAAIFARGLPPPRLLFRTPNPSPSPASEGREQYKCSDDYPTTIKE